MNRRVTVRDVAAEAGVSQATASRVLAGNESVDPALARKVQEATRKLGYTANVMARALRTQHTGTIGVVVPSISNPYFISVVEALEGVLAETQRSLILCDARDSPAIEADRIALLLGRMVDGLIVIPVSATDSAEALRSASGQRPVLQFDRYVASAGTDFIGTDNRDGLRQMIEHVRALGCESFAYVGSRATTSTAVERLEAFRALASTPHLSEHWELLGEYNVDWGLEAGRRLLDSGALPDAIICSADLIAVGVLTVLKDAGVRVPDDVKVVSYDDSMMGRITSPTLTSVRQPVEEMAREAIRLLDGGPGQSSARKCIFTPQLIVRESTGAEPE
ncbi:LacI family DNA-binding transcriptional regulator [Sinomonas sp. JGH33]|uniref:LacI family DNA-binding transcriptional regulator n=1 Tax=Sinomonas terricola TaxID=3110330 RepID=A0ABU5T697_9MICC|nr:LacI family DNA-binding transcriptional regulator [Sinomonas sp. JGH33]MEA5455155.1 LacI family DNA-binding transcriptional regulator [Sinomonas sp. JGH33]